jgi:hypothetical protein
MSRLSIFAAAAVLSALTATPVAFAKEHHHVRKAPQYINIVRPSQGYAALGWAHAAPRSPAALPSQRTCWRYFGGPKGGAWTTPC